MKISEIKIGERYTARILGVMTTVRVLAIRNVPPPWHAPDSIRRCTRIDIIIEISDRQTTLDSAATLRGPAPTQSESSCSNRRI